MNSIRRLDQPGAVFMLECVDSAEAQQVMQRLPLAAAGSLEYDVLPPGPFVTWERLFKDA